MKASNIIELLDNPMYEMADTNWVIEPGNTPKKIKKAYKLFKLKNGGLYPLFIGKNKETPMNIWLIADFIPTKGYAERPGWHSGILPIAPHLRRKSTGKINSNRVWAEVSVSADKDWSKDPEMTKNGITGKVPKDGYYKFKTNKMQGGAWIISGALKVNKVLSDFEVSKILSKAGYPKSEIENEMHDPEFNGRI